MGELTLWISEEECSGKREEQVKDRQQKFTDVSEDSKAANSWNKVSKGETSMK